MAKKTAVPTAISERWPDSYFFGWQTGDVDRSPGNVDPQGFPKTPPIPHGVTSKNVDAMSQFAASAWQVTAFEPVFTAPSMPLRPPPPLTGIEDLNDDVRRKVLERYQRLYGTLDKSLYREHEFKWCEERILDRLQCAQFREAIKEERRRLENLHHGAMLSEELEYEVTTEMTAGFEIPEEERFVKYYLPPSPPPGPRPTERGAFHIIVDGSGSMSALCGSVCECSVCRANEETRRLAEGEDGGTWQYDIKNAKLLREDGKKKIYECEVCHSEFTFYEEEVGLNRFHVATSIVWTFIKEAESINIQGHSHYIGIYGFDNGFFYPVGCSEFPVKTPLHPLPSEDISIVKRDFLRYWPERDYAHGGTEWSKALTALVDDYITFGAGDVILICDGEITDDMNYLWESDASKLYGTIYNIPTISEDETAPTLLMKLQKFMRINECGTGYVFWIVGHADPPNIECPKCKSGKKRRFVAELSFVRLDREKRRYVMKCSAGHEFMVDPVSECRSGCPLQSYPGCPSCKYLYLPLGGMFERGRNIFKGTTAMSLIHAVATTLHHQKKRRIERGMVMDISDEEEEEEED